MMRRREFIIALGVAGDQLFQRGQVGDGPSPWRDAVHRTKLPPNAFVGVESELTQGNIC
jgi:hypothetical protein